ncbi:hypothetical protein Tco_0083887 [Tanacetum coccineum]
MHGASSMMGEHFVAFQFPGTQRYLVCAIGHLFELELLVLRNTYRDRLIYQRQCLEASGVSLTAYSELNRFLMVSSCCLVDVRRSKNSFLLSQNNVTLVKKKFCSLINVEIDAPISLM